MTERDNSSERFLERWSRKKIEAEHESADAAAAPEPATRPEMSVSPAPRADDSTAIASQANPKLEFDMASLPPLDSITAITDVRAFLAPGVPKELARAALRRAWSADPAIRDFVGLAENAWDFTDPAAMPGFGDLPADYDIKKLLAQVFGESDAPDAAMNKPANPQMAGIVEKTAPPATTVDAPRATAGGQEIASNPTNVVDENLVQRDSNIAAHNSNHVDEAEEPRKRPQHGGALPQ